MHSHMSRRTLLRQTAAMAVAVAFPVPARLASASPNSFLLRKPPDRLSRGRDCIKKTHPYPYGNIV
jgi:hypothetical protein